MERSGSTGKMQETLSSIPSTQNERKKLNQAKERPNTKVKGPEQGICLALGSGLGPLQEVSGGFAEEGVLRSGRIASMFWS